MTVIELMQILGEQEPTAIILVDDDSGSLKLTVHHVTIDSDNVILAI